MGIIELVIVIAIPSGDNMLREVKGRFVQGKIEPLEDLVLDEGEEVVILIEVRDRPQSLFGLLQGSATIKGDIISPLDVVWGALQ